MTKQNPQTLCKNSPGNVLRTGTAAFFVLFCFLVIREAGAGEPIQAVWVEAGGEALKTNASCKALVEHLREINTTDIFVETYALGVAYYNSKKFPRPDGFAARGHDPLGVVVQEARRPGAVPIRVHAVVYPLRVHNDAVPLQGGKNHPLNLHPDWVAQDRAKRKRDADRNAWLDPGVPEARRHAESVLTEILTRYGLDGIHFAGLRYPGNDLRWGYNPVALAQFRADTKRVGPPPEPTDPEWVRWRTDRITSLLVRLSELVRQTRPNSIISVSAVAEGPAPAKDAAAAQKPAFQTALQDWPSWRSNELVDWIVLENFHANGQHPERFGQWIEFATQTPANVKIVAAVSGKLNSGSDVMRQMRLALDKKTDGLLLFSYETPTSNMVAGADILRYLGNTLYRPVGAGTASALLPAHGNIGSVPTGTGDDFQLVKVRSFDGALAEAPAGAKLPVTVADLTALSHLTVPPNLPPPLPMNGTYTQSDVARALLGLGRKKPAPPPSKSPSVSQRLFSPPVPPPTPAVPKPLVPDTPLMEITLQDGRTLKGRIAARNAKTTTIFTASGVKLVLSNKRIEAIQPIR